MDINSNTRVTNISNSTQLSSTNKKSALSTTILLVSELKDFESLKTLWSDLYNRQPNKENYLQHDWINCSWKWSENFSTANLICFYNNQELIAIFPWVIENRYNKNIFKFMSGPLDKFNDALIDSKHINIILKTLFELLQKWSEHWDIIDLSNIPKQSILLNFFMKSKKNKIPFKFKVKKLKKQSYIPLSELSNNWKTWLLKQKKYKVRRFIKIKGLYSPSYKIQNNYNHEKSINNTNNILSEYIHNKLSALKVYRKNNKNTIQAVNSFIKKFSYYNTNNSWLSIFKFNKDYQDISKQYNIISKQNSYYLFNSKEIIALNKNQKILLQSVILKNYIDNQIRRFYLANKDIKAWQKFWIVKKEYTYQLLIFNKKRSIF